MKSSLSRRQFLGATAAATVAMGAFSLTETTEAQESDTKFKTRLYKARIGGKPTEELCEKWKKAGYEGMESTAWDISPEEAREGRRIAEKCDFRVHSVMRAWTNINVDDPEKVKADIESVRKALRTAAEFGASTVLWVPCKIGGMKMPEAWDFNIDFNPKTLMVKSVAPGDNSAYADYIAAQNKATEATLRAVEELIPCAAKEGVSIGLENVWNNLWSTPKFFGSLFKYFDEPWFGCYFDLGNHTKYARCEAWLDELKHRILKLHIKDFKVNEVKGELGGGPGNWANIGKGSIDWKSVRKKLDEIGYSGWLTVEEGGYSDEEYSKILDGIIG